jgi:modification methylase
MTASPTKRDAPRIPFGSLVEQGRIAPGTILFDRQRRVSATVTADGTLLRDRDRGSIHQLGARVQNAPTCNGWLFWHFERDGRLLPLDQLRTELWAAPP